MLSEEERRTKTLHPWQRFMLHPDTTRGCWDSHCPRWQQHKAAAEKTLTSQLLKLCPCFVTEVTSTTSEKQETGYSRLVSAFSGWTYRVSYESTSFGQQNTCWHLSSAGGDPLFWVTPPNLGWWVLMSFSTSRNFKASMLHKNEKLNVKISSYVNYCSLPRTTELQLSQAQSIEQVSSTG